MKLNDLAIFVEVARAPSLREAAKQLALQPGTVSKQIKRIEGYYQQQLFARKGVHWSLTEAGEMLFQRALEMLAINDKIERELGKPRRPHMRVSGSEAVLGYFAPELMSKLLERKHDVTLETKTSQDLSMLLKHEVDVALVSSLTGYPPSERQIIATELRQANFVTVGSPKHPLCQPREEGCVETPIETLLNHSFVVPSKPIYGAMATHRSLDGWHDEAFSRRITARLIPSRLLSP
ncbi:transcriptional regulator of rhamnose utilization LysR family [Vibrio maritimus]|uniref:Transcriptional regulator of rhamnose utilization LysR family n=1 Tax=Vibrio maritimus TaxID=990268 RepID=A0A090T664_9VIBR|nr:transcriptional regulator of rhamnose utilization LysR family [Vibrio maritimus]